MSTMAPGTYVQEATSPTFTASSPTTTLACFVGGHNRGPTTPVLIRSWSQFVALYGGFSSSVTPSNLQLAVYTFFNNGGGQCYVLRVAHNDAAAASQTLEDTQATPVATLSVTAANPGAWGDNIWVETIQNADGTFNLAVYYAPGASSSASAITQANLVEPIWTRLSMNKGSSRYAPSVINNPNTGSQYIRVTDLNDAFSPNTPAGSTQTPQVIQLGTGSGSTVGADGATVTSTDLVGVTPLLDEIPNPLLINLPGVTDQTGAINPYISYITTQRAWADSVLIIDTPENTNPAVSDVSAVVSYVGTITTSSYAAVYYPWVNISDPASTVPGAMRAVPPGGAVMGVIARTDALQGVQKAPAGLQASLSALGPQRNPTATDLAALNGANINAIRFKQGAGTVIWGARTLSTVTSTLYLNVRRTLIFVESSLKALSDFAVFENNGYRLWQQLFMRADGFLSRLWASGALAGSTAAAAYFVVCDQSNNDSSSGTVNIQAGVACQDPAEFVIISVGQWQGGTTVTEAVSPQVAI